MLFLVTCVFIVETLISLLRTCILAQTATASLFGFDGCAQAGPDPGVIDCKGMSG